MAAAPRRTTAGLATHRFSPVGAPCASCRGAGLAIAIPEYRGSPIEARVPGVFANGGYRSIDELLTAGFQRNRILPAILVGEVAPSRRLWRQRHSFTGCGCSCDKNCGTTLSQERSRQSGQKTRRSGPSDAGQLKARNNRRPQNSTNGKPKARASSGHRAPSLSSTETAQIEGISSLRHR